MILNPYIILASVAAAAVLSAGSFYAGHDWATTKAEAARAKQAEAHIQQINQAITHGNELTKKLAAAESKVITRTIEVIKNVPQVTTGRLCLDSAAVGLLNSTEWGPYQTPGKPADKSPAPSAASDRDIAYWIAESQRLYEICAGRLNGLVDFHAGE